MPNSVSNFSHYEVIRAGNVTGSPDRLRCLPGYVAPPVRDGVDEPFLAQHANRPARGRARDLELFDHLALSRYPHVRRILARGDAPPDDLRDLPIRWNRGDRVNTVIAVICHRDNFSCTCLTSHRVRCADVT